MTLDILKGDVEYRKLYCIWVASHLQFVNGIAISAEVDEDSLAFMKEVEIDQKKEDEQSSVNPSYEAIRKRLRELL